VLAKFATKKTVKYFVGLFQETGSDCYNIQFLRKRLKFWIFFSEINKNTSVIECCDVVLKLPQLEILGRSGRNFGIIFGLGLVRLKF
jgi:hypothetical protein